MLLICYNYGSNKGESTWSTTGITSERNLWNGKYPLIDEFLSYQVDPVRWVSLKTDQRKVLVEKVITLILNSLNKLLMAIIP